MNTSSQISKLAVADTETFIALIKLFEQVFEMKPVNIPGIDYLRNLLSNNSFHVFVAKIDDRVVGGLTAYTLDAYFSEGANLYIYDLAIAEAHQRQGIGSQLIKSVKEYFGGSTITEIFVQADLEDDYAVEFYRSTGGREENVVSFSYWTNKAN